MTEEVKLFVFSLDYMYNHNEKNWISISVILVIIVAVLMFYKFSYLQYLFDQILLLFLWCLVVFYILSNAFRDPLLKKNILKIKKPEVYENWPFLTALAIIFGVVVWGFFSNIDRALGTGLCVVLFGFLFAWVRDILKHHRDKLS